MTISTMTSRMEGAEGHRDVEPCCRSEKLHLVANFVSSLAIPSSSPILCLVWPSHPRRQFCVFLQLGLLKESTHDFTGLESETEVFILH